MGKQNELKKIGEIYRELRLDKGTKLSNYIDKGFSKSQLSRFERGETEISLIKFFKCIRFYKCFDRRIYGNLQRL